MYQEFTRMLIRKEMTANIKAMIKNPELNLKRDQFSFYEENNDHDIQNWYLVRNNVFADLKTKLDSHEITHFTHENKLYIGLTIDVKNDQKLRTLYEDYLLG